MKGITTILSLSLIFISWIAAAQSGTIRGNIKTSDGAPAEFVNIGLKGTPKGAMADQEGKFEIKNIEPGNYTLVVSFVGLETKEINIEVKANEITEIPEITLSENAKTLKEVVITANKIDKESGYVAKMPLKNLENPQVFNSVSSEIMKQQAITSYDDIFRNVPGVAQSWQSTGRDGDGAAYFSLRGLEAQPSLVNGLPGITNGNLDPANIEQVQILKGPSATLFGANASSYTSYGGIINTITKKPYYKRGGELVYHVGSFGLNRLTMDANLLLSEKEKIALRVNGAYHNEGSFQDAGFKKSLFLAPSLAYQLNDRLDFLVVTEVLEEERAVPPVFFHSNRTDALTFRNVEELNLDTDLSFTTNDLTIRNPRTNIQAQMNYKLSKTWTSQTIVSRGTSKSKGYYTYIWADIEGDNNFGQYFTYCDESKTTTDIQQNFNGDFKIGSLRNRIVLGLDYFNRQSVNQGLGYVFVRNVTPQGDENFIDPYTGDTLAAAYLSRASIDNLLAGTQPGNSNVSNSTSAAYVSNVLNITPKIAVLTGVRANYFYSEGEKKDSEDNYDQIAFSPKFGLVYQPILNKISVFGNYQNGFYNVDPVQVADPDGSNPRIKTMKPEQAVQWEGGVKLNVWRDKLYTTVSYYDIQVSNRVIGDVNNFYNSVQGGKVESKGFELDLAANPFNGVNIIAGFSHNETYNKEGVPGDFYSEAGRVPGGQGPQNQVNFWMTYKIPVGRLENFGLGFGGNYASEYRVIDNSLTGTFDLPAYTVLNSSLFYNSDKLRVTFNVNNLTDTKYYIGYWSVNPQKPINMVTSVAFKF